MNFKLFINQYFKELKLFINRPFITPSAFDKVEIDSLYGLRALCVFIVILSHIRNTQNVPFFISSGIKYLIFGGLGVQMFFVISGFLITSILLKEVIRGKRQILLSFFIKRFLKIFPVFYVYLISTYILFKNFNLSVNYNSFTSSALFIENFNYSGNWITGHSWSLSVEEQFYLIWPFMILYTRLRNILFFIFLIFNYEATSLIISYLLNSKYFLILSPLLSYLPPIMLGSLISIIFFKGYQISSRFISGFYAFLCLLLILIISTLDRLHLYDFLIQPFAYLINSFLLGYMFIYVIHLEPHTFWFEVLNNKFTVYMGRISYSVYVWQQLFLIPAGFYAYNFWFTSFPINFVLILIVASISYEFIEIPCLNFRNKLLMKISG